MTPLLPGSARMKLLFEALLRGSGTDSCSANTLPSWSKSSRNVFATFRADTRPLSIASCSIRRWRRVLRLIEGLGEWLQLSAFQCRLSAQRHAELIALLDGIIHHNHDHVIFMDIGIADQVFPKDCVPWEDLSTARAWTPNRLVFLPTARERSNGSPISGQRSRQEAL